MINALLDINLALFLMIPASVWWFRVIVDIWRARRDYVREQAMKRTAALVVLLAFALLAACTRTVYQAAPAAPARPHNIAEDNLLTEVPAAKCERVWDLPELHSVRCTLPDSAILYCTASFTGYGCSALKVPPKAKTEAPPISPPETKPDTKPEAKTEAPKKK